MKNFLVDRFKNLEAYVPGEQPKDMKYIKLNTNESPFSPPLKASEYASRAAKSLNLYSDPECSQLSEMLSEHLGIKSSQLLLTNGSDEILNFAFMAFCADKKAAGADITYGFYKVFAALHNVDYEKIPLMEDFSIDTKNYIGINKTIFIANPNAPTGLALKRNEIEKIIASNPDNVVVVDEAYVDFGAESCIGLIDKYDNLLVTQTFSKSRAMAGARLGFGAGNEKLIETLKLIKYSTNPYNVNSLTQAAAIGVLEEEEYTKECITKIKQNREYTLSELKRLGFTVTKSEANFIFAKHNMIGGEELYRKLKKRGILVRHFKDERIKEYNRITIGTKEQMISLVSELEDILKNRI